MKRYLDDIAVLFLAPYVVALGECLVQLRRVLLAELARTHATTGSGPGGPGEVPPHLHALLDTVRRIQSFVGRPCDDAPDWFEAIIETHDTASAGKFPYPPVPWDVLMEKHPLPRGGDRTERS